MWFTNVNGQDIEATEQREIATNIDRALESGLHAYVKEGYKLIVTTKGEREATSKIWVGGAFFVGGLVLSLLLQNLGPAYLGTLLTGATSFLLSFLLNFGTTVTIISPSGSKTTYYFWDTSNAYYTKP